MPDPRNQNQSTADHPFYAGTFDGHVCIHCDAVSRCHVVPTFSMDECLAALKLPDLQQTVRDAVGRRMRFLARQAKAADQKS